jgi:hypothetical protein
LRPSLLRSQIDKGRVFAEAGIDYQRGDRRQVGTGDPNDGRSMLRHGPAGHRAGDHAREVEHSQATKRPAPCMAERLDRPTGQAFKGNR